MHTRCNSRLNTQKLMESGLPWCIYNDQPHYIPEGRRNTTHTKKNLKQLESPKETTGSQRVTGRQHSTAQSKTQHQKNSTEYTTRKHHRGQHNAYHHSIFKKAKSDYIHHNSTTHITTSPPRTSP